MRILYVGASAPASTAAHRAAALRRLGHEVLHLDPYRAMGHRLRGPWHRLHYHTGYVMLASVVGQWLDVELERAVDFDAAWVDSGELLDAGAVNALRRQCQRVVLFNHDDPTGPRDGRRFATLRKAIPAYDLCVVVRQLNVGELKSLGARDVLRSWRTYDEVAHAPLAPYESVADRLKSEVCFVGTMIPGEGRDEFLLELSGRGVPVSIWGNRWQRSRHWRRLQDLWRGPAVFGRDYVHVVAGAKVALGLLSKGNRDEHTTRSMEIPFAGGLLCAQRTAEHLELFADEHQAVFWSDAKECAAACQELLANGARRESIRRAGMARVREMGVGSESLGSAVLRRLFGSCSLETEPPSAQAPTQRHAKIAIRS